MVRTQGFRGPRVHSKIGYALFNSNDDNILRAARPENVTYILLHSRTLIEIYRYEGINVFE